MKVVNQLMFLPVLLYFFIMRKRKKRMYDVFRQLAYSKWYKWQWRILDKVMK